MATVREVIIPAERKKDGTWNVKIRFIHKGKSLNLKTEHFVTAKQLRKDFSIKDQFLLDLLHPVLREYRTKISALGTKVELFDVGRLVSRLSQRDLSAEEINIIEFGKMRIEELKGAERNASAANMTTVVNSLINYFKSEVVPVTEIRSKMLFEYEKYLRSTRKITRLDQFNKPYQRTVQGLSDNGLHNHMRDLRILFNAVKNHYNDEDLDITVIRHYPFKKYKLVNVTENTKPKLTILQVRAVKEFVSPENSRMELAHDLFLLSFYLCGMNAVDLYQLQAPGIMNERIDYNRSKTRSRRRDRAFISVNVPEPAIPYFNKYAGQLQVRYASHVSLDRALSIGMRAIGKKLGIPDLEFYDARHAFGDWARNICRFSKDDVALALNHKDQTRSVTDTYISKNWDIIDEVQAAVICLLSNIDEECS
ncbi:site-specific integrase [Mucilaginibacter sp.]